MVVGAGWGIVGGRDTRFPKGLGAGAGVWVAHQRVTATRLGSGHGRCGAKGVWGTGAVGARASFAEAGESSERLGAGAVVANGCSRTSGCTGAGAHRCFGFIPCRRAGPVNLGVRRLQLASE